MPVKGGNVTNIRMAEKLERGDCIAVDQRGIEIAPGVTLLDEDITKDTIDGVDLCIRGTQSWIGSVGLKKADGRLYASVDNRFYGHPEYECVWLR